MFCYHCGARLSEHDFCTACGADVSLYKKIMAVSNKFYNEGLERASVRDLSGAVNSLRQSLKFNKNHIEARNLLGLVYFEMGEVVAALSEWVISKNLRPEKNVADDYITTVQSNVGRLDALNQTMKKYNQALLYCKQDSKDLAVIQLKKVLSMNTKFVRAHQLLALLYMDMEDWEKAKKELNKCVKIDRNNTMTLRYMQEVDHQLAPDENVKQPPKRKKEEAIRYQADNEMIIQPLNVKEPKNTGLSTLLNIAIGILIGLAVMYFLIVPAAVSNANNEAQKKYTELGNQLDSKTSRVQELEYQVENLQGNIDILHEELEGYVGSDGTLQTIDNLLNAASAYLENGDLAETAKDLEFIAQNVDVASTSEAFQKLYNALLATIGPELAGSFYTEGYNAYRNNDFETAIANLTKAVYYNSEDLNSLYYLADAYRQNGDMENAVVYFDQIIEKYPDTDKGRRAKQYRDSIVGDEE